MEEFIDKEVLKLKSSPYYKKIHNKIYKYLKKGEVEKYYYYFKVWEQTEMNCHEVKGIKTRSWQNQLDHIIPISLGFEIGIPIYIISDIKNLRIIPKKENFRKGKNITELVKEKLICFGVVYHDNNKTPTPPLPKRQIKIKDSIPKHIIKSMEVMDRKLQSLTFRIL
jgi:hypothetical protein